MENTTPTNPSPTPTPSPDTPSTSSSDSLLETIIQESQSSGVPTTPAADTTVSQPTPVSSSPSTPPSSPSQNTTTTIVSKKVQPISYSMVLKFIGTIFIVALIFFGSFLAYIVFNPSQAQFFVNFGINPNDVALFLGKLVNAIFGIIVLLTSILWIILLFRALWTAKDLKRKRLLRWLLSGFVGIILFSCITLWAYLVQTINATDYSNPGGTVLLYDHALWSEETFRDQSQIFQTSELIGPVTVLFDISANAKLTEDKNLFTIESFAINFDGAKCADGSTVVTGKSPKTDKTIICTFDKIQVYNPQGKYIGRDRNGEPKEINMFLPSIEIRGLVDIKKQRNKDNKNIITFDASGLRNLGKILWIYDNKSQVEQPSITEVE